MTQTTEQIAAQQVQGLLADYLGRAYVEAHFSEKAKQDVEEMIHEFLEIYKTRIEALDWMSDATKQKAICKLDTMKIKVGYPDSWETYLDNADIKSPSEGGTFFSNVISIQASAKEKHLPSRTRRLTRPTGSWSRLRSMPATAQHPTTSPSRRQFCRSRFMM